MEVGPGRGEDPYVGGSEMDSELRPLDRIIAECMADSGAIASRAARNVDLSYSMATILDVLLEAGKEKEFFGKDPPERKKQVDRLRSCVKRMVTDGFMGEKSSATDGKGKGYYVFQEELPGEERKIPNFEVTEAKPQKTTDEERMARPEWGRKLTLKVYKEWIGWSADFSLRKLTEGKAEENGIDLPEDFTGDDLCTMWGAGGSGFNERKLIKQLREKFPVAKAAKS